ncbi:unnamed protein product [Spirodela intermedia]|uniref:Uncharacterized protein n=1 Tax=Spirodela intermedia TaxID=51605 RepID=A0A7I8KFZ9_SPIIN|nr:unnamed protein product [Spirodela intermedia]
MEMRRRGGGAPGDVGDGDGDSEARGRRRVSFLTRCVEAVFAFVKLAEFEILFILFLVVAFLIFKDLTSQPRYNQILVKKPGDDDFWPFPAFQRKD